MSALVRTTKKQAAGGAAPAEKKRRGVSGPPLDIPPVGRTARKGVRVSNPEMEALIEQAPDDPQGYLIYADWLQQRGDARGELIVLQCARAADPESYRLASLEKALLKTYRAELLFGLGPVQPERGWTANNRTPYRGLTWEYGFLREVRMSRARDASLAESVAALLGHPSARLLRALVLGHTGETLGEPSDYREVLSVLSARAPRTLRSLTLAANPGGGDLGAGLALLRHVERLVVCGEPSLDASSPAAVRELHLIDYDDETLAHWARVDWSGLTQLEILCTPEVRRESTAGLVSMLGRAPNVRRLTLRHQMDDMRGEPVSSDWLLEAVAAAKPPQLQHLDLDIGLMRTEAVRPFDRLLASIAHVCLPIGRVAARDRKAYERAMPNVEWLAEIPEQASPWV